AQVMKLWLYLPCEPDVNTCPPVTHDDYVLALSAPDARATLTSFSGRLGSSAAILQLPPTLQLLGVGVTVAELPTLIARLPHLPQLGGLGISIQCRDMASVSALTQLQLPTSGRRLSLEIDVYLYGAGNTDGRDIGTLLQRLTTGREWDKLDLYLYDATISGVGLIQLLQTLRQEQGMCKDITIWSSQPPPTDLEEVKTRSSGCVKGEIKWHCGSLKTVIDMK
ncbi:unnamed protein product, partial [Meganyctiphanes norvegica]